MSKDRMTRREVLEFAGHLLDPKKAMEALKRAKSGADRATFGMLHLWAQHGAQTVEMSHKYAAALMASDARGVIEGEHLPWPAFEVQVPSGLLRSSVGEVAVLLVAMVPDGLDVVGPKGKYPDHKMAVAYMDEYTWGINSYRDLAHMLNDKEVREYFDEAYETELCEYLADDFDLDQEFRLWKLIARLVCGAVIAINTARIDKPEVYPLKPIAWKGDRIRPHVARIGQPVEIDCRNLISDYLEGRRHASPALTFGVRGHYRWQAYGPQHTLRRRQWIPPHRKGSGPMVLNRPTRLKDPHAED